MREEPVKDEKAFTVLAVRIASDIGLHVTVYENKLLIYSSKHLVRTLDSMNVISSVSMHTTRNPPFLCVVMTNLASRLSSSLKRCTSSPGL